MIGLKKNTVEIVEHQPEWAKLAADACQEVRRMCGDLLADVQHVGSSAVPDLPAKPILDLAVAAYTLDTIPEFIERLACIGYIYRGQLNEEDHLFVMESSPDIRTIDLHITEHDGIEWRNYIIFRDQLRQNPEIRKQYAELKQRLWSIFALDRKSYTAAKNEFIRGILEPDKIQQK